MSAILCGHAMGKTQAWLKYVEIN